MLDFLLSTPVVSFSVALGLLAGLLILEIMALLLGGTLLGKGMKAGDFDIDIGVDSASADFQIASLPSSVDLSQVDMGIVSLSDLDLGSTVGANDTTLAKPGT